MRKMLLFALFLLQLIFVLGCNVTSLTKSTAASSDTTSASSTDTTSPLGKGTVTIARPHLASWANLAMLSLRRHQGKGASRAFLEADSINYSITQGASQTWSTTDSPKTNTINGATSADSVSTFLSPGSYTVTVSVYNSYNTAQFSSNPSVIGSKNFTVTANETTNLTVNCEPYSATNCFQSTPYAYTYYSDTSWAGGTETWYWISPTDFGSNNISISLNIPSDPTAGGETDLLWAVFYGNTAASGYSDLIDSYIDCPGYADWKSGLYSSSGAVVLPPRPTGYWIVVWNPYSTNNPTSATLEWVATSNNVTITVK
jgi:hypothetical protein